MANTESKFTKWFEQQFGKRPSKEPEDVLYSKVVEARYALSEAQDLLERVELWEAQEQAALYAWQVNLDKPKSNI